jgi:hypothetical protein
MYMEQHRPSTGYSPPDPAWIVFRSGPYATRMPVEDVSDILWRYVLDITSIGFRADRCGDEIIITGCPSDDCGGLLS